MGFLFSSNQDKLSEKEIKKALRQAGILETSDRERLRQLLRSRRGGGVTRQDIVEVTRRMKKETDDNVNRTESAAARRELLHELNADEDS